MGPRLVTSWGPWRSSEPVGFASVRGLYRDRAVLLICSSTARTREREREREREIEKRWRAATPNLLEAGFDLIGLPYNP